MNGVGVEGCGSVYEGFIWGDWLGEVRVVCRG